MPAVQETIDQVRQIDVDQYKYGFETVIEKRHRAEGSERGHHPDDLGQEGRAGMDARVAAGRLQALADMEEPTWARVDYPKIDFQDIYYYSAPKSMTGPKSIDDVDPELLRVPTRSSAFRCANRKSWPASARNAKVAVDAVFDSVSVVTTFKEELPRPA
jgi:Fe-S cluster assembly protein SufB